MRVTLTDDPNSLLSEAEFVGPIDTDEIWGRSFDLHPDGRLLLIRDDPRATDSEIFELRALVGWGAALDTESHTTR